MKELDTNKLPLPTTDSRAWRMDKDAARSFAQIFLPSTTPAKRYFPAGKLDLICSIVFVPRTRSKPKPVTPFKEVRVLQLY
jgi:hypothetical protein